MNIVVQSRSSALDMTLWNFKFLGAPDTNAIHTEWDDLRITCIGESLVQGGLRSSLNADLTQYQAYCAGIYASQVWLYGEGHLTIGGGTTELAQDNANGGYGIFCSRFYSYIKEATIKGGHGKSGIAGVNGFNGNNAGGNGVNGNNGADGTSGQNGGAGRSGIFAFLSVDIYAGSEVTVTGGNGSSGGNGGHGGNGGMVATERTVNF